MRTKTFLLTSLFALVLSPVASAAEKLRVAFSVVGVASSPSWIAVEKGLWSKYGLDVELILLSGGTRSVPALVSGNVQVLIGSDIGVIQAIAQGIWRRTIAMQVDSVRFEAVWWPVELSGLFDAENG